MQLTTMVPPQSQCNKHKNRFVEHRSVSIKLDILNRGDVTGMDQVMYHRTLL